MIKNKYKENKSQVLTHYTSSIWGSSCLFSRACVQQCVMLWKQPFWPQQWCLWWPPPGGRPQSPGARLRIPCGAAQLGQMAKTHQKYIRKKSWNWTSDYSDHFACNSARAMTGNGKYVNLLGKTREINPIIFMLATVWQILNIKSMQCRPETKWKSSQSALKNSRD
jgi:hypothetical protein